MSQMKLWTIGIAVTVMGFASCGQDQQDSTGAGDSSKATAQATQQDQEPSDESEERGKTHHDKLLDENGQPRFTNSLIDETSPYLLQHAHNPVNWHPWGEAALQKAKDENKLIFLSVGYSSCHWCHVMEHESFMDEEIAQYLNDNFICIKVDREERPDVDAVYMESLHVVNQVMRTGRGGGWPLSMFMLPDSRPFFGGTYFPARTGDRGPRIGFMQILERIDGVWDATPEKLEKDAKTITDLTRRSLKDSNPATEKVVKIEWFKYAMADLKQRFDPEWGGFSFNPTNDQVPKFPEESKLMLLARTVKQNPDDASAKEMMIRTADRMMMGGIHDHVGGGFHRYSVDRYWRIPHYEKMLYNNGQLTSFYSEAFALTGDPAYRKVVEEMLEFVQREMLAPDGGYFAALDADSEGEEGKFYVWDREEIQSLLTDEEYQLYAAVFGINGAPNFEGKHYSPVLSQRWSEVATTQGMKLEELWAKLKPINQKLFEYRAQRVRPGTDSKVLTSWNGLMIRGLADAGRLLENPQYTQRAEKAARFVLEKLQQEDGRLLRTYTAGEAKLNGYLDDYAFLIDGLIALHVNTGDEQWLEHAMRLQQKQNELFHDSDGGGFYFTSSDHQELLAKTKDPVDAAIPSGNGVSVSNLIYLADKRNKPEYIEMAKGVIYSTNGLLDRVPIATARLLESIVILADDK